MVLDNDSAVFQKGQGKLNGCKAKITLDSQSTPWFCSALCTKDKRLKVEEEIDCLTADSIIESKQFAD